MLVIQVIKNPSELGSPRFEFYAPSATFSPTHCNSVSLFKKNEEGGFIYQLYIVNKESFHWQFEFYCWFGLRFVPFFEGV